MEEEEIDIVGSQTLQGVVQGPEDVVVAVQMVPDLGRDEEVLPRDRRVFLEVVLDRLTDLVLVEIEPGAIKVPVANAESMKDGVVGLARAAFTGEGTETDGGNRDAVAELEGETVRHFDCGSKQKQRSKG